MTTPNLGLDEVPSNSLQPSVPINLDLQALDALVHLSVQDKDLTAPPTTVLADVGKRWIVGASATGAWAGKDGQIALCTAADTWRYFVPAEGWRADVRDEDKAYRYSGTGWALIGETAASGVSITDAGGYFTATDVEGALQELGAGGGAVVASAVSIFDPSKDGGTLSSAKLEYTNVAAGATQTVVNIASGAGYISSLFLAFSTTNSATWRTGLIKIYYDGEVTPTVSVPMERFFCNIYMGNSASSKLFFHEFLGFNAATDDKTCGMFLNLPIPYSNGIKIEITNGGGVAMTVFATATIHTGVANSWTRTKKLRVQDFYVASAAANSVNTLIDVSGLNPGRVAMVWFLEDDVPGSLTPNGASLEGNIKFYMDGAASPNYESSGTEDYYLQSFYSANIPTGAQNGEVGMTFRNGNATTSFYRFHVRNPVTFENALKITWNCGDTSQVAFTGTARVWATVFYYTG